MEFKLFRACKVDQKNFFLHTLSLRHLSILEKEPKSKLRRKGSQRTSPFLIVPLFPKIIFKQIKLLNLDISIYHFHTDFSLSELFLFEIYTRKAIFSVYCINWLKISSRMEIYYWLSRIRAPH